MAKYLIFGAGHIGPAIVNYLILSQDTVEVHVLDQNKNKLENLLNKFSTHVNKEKIKVLNLSIEDAKLNRLMTSIDVMVVAMPWLLTFELIKKTRQTNIPIVSVTRPEVSQLDELVKIVSLGKASVVPGCGLEPGLTEILASYIISVYQNITKLNIYCGGIPTVPKPPLYYKQVFGTDLPILQKMVYKFKNGLIKVPRFSEIEHIELKDIGLLEAWHDGMSPHFPAYINSPDLNEVNQKTLRWPGFVNTLTCLQQLGFMDQSAIQIQGVTITPYQVTQHLLKQHARFDEKDKDMVILHIHAKTKDDKTITATFRHNYEETFHLSAMSCVTGYLAGMASQKVFQKRDKGLIYPEQLFMGKDALDLFKQLSLFGAELVFSKL